MDLKKTRKGLLSAVMAALLVLVMGATTAFAAGSCSVTVNNAAKGQTYTLYKVFDATYDGKAVSYTVKADAPAYAAAKKADSPFDVSAQANSKGGYAVTLKAGKGESDVVAWFNANFKNGKGLQQVEQKVADTSTVKFTNLDPAYYLVTSTNGNTSAISVTTANPNGVTKEKNTVVPTPPTGGVESTKTITGVNGVKPENPNSVSAQIGDTISFKVEFNAVNFRENAEGVNTKVEWYKVTDTSNGLLFNKDLKVTVDGADVPSTEWVTPPTVQNDNGFVLQLKWLDEKGEPKYKSPAKVVLTYTAKLVATDANNSAKIDSSVQEGEIIDPTNPVKSYALDLVKTDADKKLLNGAQFKLYGSKAGSDEIKVVKESEGVYRVATPAEIEANKAVAIEAGKVTIKGLSANKTYWFEEILAPNGYNKLTERKSIKMGAADNTATMKGDTYVQGGLQIVNNKGGLLPETGGMGTTILYIAGAALIVCAGVALVARRRASINE